MHDDWLTKFYLNSTQLILYKYTYLLKGSDTCARRYAELDYISNRVYRVVTLGGNLKGGISPLKGLK